MSLELRDSSSINSSNKTLRYGRVDIEEGAANPATDTPSREGIVSLPRVNSLNSFLKQLNSLTTTERSLAYVGVVNSVYVILQLVVAAQTGSLAMLSDAFHNLSDVGAAWVAFKCERYRRTSAPLHLPFGYLRMQVLGAFVNAICLVSLAAYLILSALPLLVFPAMSDQRFNPTPTFVGVAATGVLLNLASAFLLCCGVEDSEGNPLHVHAHVGGGGIGGNATSCDCGTSHEAPTGTILPARTNLANRTNAIDANLASSSKSNNSSPATQNVGGELHPPTKIPLFLAEPGCLLANKVLMNPLWVNPTITTAVAMVAADKCLDACCSTDAAATLPSETDAAMQVPFGFVKKTANRRRQGISAAPAALPLDLGPQAEEISASFFKVPPPLPQLDVAVTNKSRKSSHMPPSALPPQLRSSSVNGESVAGQRLRRGNRSSRVGAKKESFDLDPDGGACDISGSDEATDQRKSPELPERDPIKNTVSDAAVPHAAERGTSRGKSPELTEEANKKKKCFWSSGQDSGGDDRDGRRMGCFLGLDDNVMAVAVHSAGDAASSLVVLVMGALVLSLKQDVRSSSSSGSGGDVDGSDDTPCSSLSSSSSSSVAVAAWSWVDALDPVVTIVLSGLMALSMVGVLRRCGAVLLESSALEPKEAADLVNDIESDPAIGLAAANLRISSLVITDLDFSATARRASATFVPATLDSALSSKRNYARTQGSTSSSDISNLDGGGHDIENINQERAPKTGSGRDHTSLRRRVKAHLAIRGVRWATLEIDDGVVDEMSG